MSKTVVFLSLIVISFWVIAVPVSAQEQNQTANSQVEITTKDLGVENPGVLPTSPFYFLKEWTRGIRKTFTFNPVKKAELELQYTNERAAEIKKMEEVAPSKINAITRAAENYQKNVEQLKNRLNQLKETTQNPNVDKLLDKIVGNSLQHQQLFDELKLKFENQPELKEKLEASQEKIGEIITNLSEKFDNIEAFKERLERAIERAIENTESTSTFNGLRVIQIIDKIKEKLPAKEQQKIEEVKKTILENKVQKQEIKAEDVENMIVEVENLIAKAEKGLENAKTEIQQSVKQLLENSKTHLDEAEKSLNEGKIANAFGQATSAGAAAKNALRMINPNQEQKFVCPQYMPISPEEKEKCYKSNGQLKVEKDENGCLGTPKCVFSTEKPVCAQVITPAISPEGVCKNFPTPCEVPSGWQKVDKCPTVSVSTCEIGKEYKHTAVSPVTCKCPQGYGFETVSIGWGPCPAAGMTDCPATVLKCVPKTQ